MSLHVDGELREWRLLLSGLVARVDLYVPDVTQQGTGEDSQKGLASTWTIRSVNLHDPILSVL